ncbi:MAG TPA: hypothetical protein VLU43_05725 [Anaeromyxobacteraceae bacterium]|nr:hypothetical protein [Anaeromyxobacteraceae bacterium]
MRLTPTLRLVAIAVLVFVATAAIWWFVGYQIGKGLLEEAGGGPTWRAAYGFREGGAARLLFVAVLSALALGVSAAAEGAARWALLAGVAFAAALTLGAREGALAGTLLFVLSVGAVDEATGGGLWLAAAGLGIVVAFAEVLDLPFTAGQAAIAVVLRGLLYWLPLLAGPHLAVRYATGKVGSR